MTNPTKSHWPTTDTAKLYELAPKVIVVNGAESREVFRTIRMPLPILAKDLREVPKSERQYALGMEGVLRREKRVSPRIPRQGRVGYVLPLLLLGLLATLALGLWKG